MIPLDHEQVSPRFRGVTHAMIRAELAREGQQRARTFPDLVSKGNMTPAEADHEQHIIAAIAADLEQVIARQPAWSESHGFTWHQRVRALRRELDLRARLYPGWIAKGRMTEAEAARQIAALAAMLAIYEGGRDWRARDGTEPAFWKDDPTPAERAARAEWIEVLADIEARRAGQQKEMSL